MEILRARADSGTGVLVVLHEMTLASRFLDRVIVMENGAIICDGPPELVLNAENLQSVYGISPLVGAHDGERWLIPWSRTGNNAARTAEKQDFVASA